MDLDKIFEVADLQLSLNVFDEYGAEYPIGLKEKLDTRIDSFTKEEQDMFIDVMMAYKLSVKNKKETMNTSTYKLGDRWSKDFDYDGMLEFGSKTSVAMGIESLQKLYDSFEDVNYHSEAGPLYYAIQLLKTNNKPKAEIYITKFIMECRDALNKNKIYYDSI
tara:strand:+ start:124 stop:612 length:489 start_codon:yes stop_codon:yes gene_type:complete